MIKLGYYSVNADFDIDSVCYDKLTHLNLSFATLKDLKGTVEFNVNDPEKIREIRRKNPNMIICLSIGGWGAGKFSEAAETVENRETFARTSMEIVKEFDLDGLDIDWEYPCSADSGISAHPDDKRNYTHMMQELRKQLDIYGEANNKKMILTFAMGAVEKLIDCMELSELEKVTDFMNIMTYDMGGSFVTTGHHTSLYPSSITKQPGGAHFVKRMDENGYPTNKIVYGSAFYGRGADEVKGREDGIFSRMYGTEGLYFDYDQVVEMINSGKYKYYYDEEAVASYIFDGNTFVTFETPKSLLKKIDYVKENNLLGIMFWEVCTDRSGKMLEAIINESTDSEI